MSSDSCVTYPPLPSGSIPGSIPGSRADVYVILDESGSMSNFVTPIRQTLQEMAVCNRDPQVSYHFIVFSDQVADGPDISRLNIRMAGTHHDIAPAFERLSYLMYSRPLPDQFIVVFISDGQDGNPGGCYPALKLLEKPTVPCLLFTIGIGDFPTGLVVDLLRPLYHQGSPTLAPVIPLCKVEDCDWVFSQLEGLIMGRGVEVGMPDTVTGETPVKDVMHFIRGTFNACAVTCAQTGRDKKENYSLLFESKGRIGQVVELMRKRLAEEKVTKREKPLASVFC